MEKIDSIEKISAAIQLLEFRQAYEEKLLKEQFYITYNSLQPLNIIRRSLNKALTTPDLRNKIIDTGIGIATGLVTKKILIGNSHNPIKKVFGFLAELGISNLVIKNPEPIKLMAFGLFNLLRKKKAM